MDLTAQNVGQVLESCLADSETAPGVVVVKSVRGSFAFDKDRLDFHRQNIKALLARLPLAFRSTALGGGGGWSFLNANEDHTGRQWGEHQHMNELVALGLATSMVQFSFPEAFWPALPGEVPYFEIVAL